MDGIRHLEAGLDSANRPVLAPHQASGAYRLVGIPLIEFPLDDSLPREACEEPVLQGCDDYFLTGQHRRHMVTELCRGAPISIGQLGSAGGHGPPGGLTDGALVPVAANARHTGSFTILEADGDAARLGPIENRARLTRMKAVREPVFRHVWQAFALEVGNLLEDDHLLVPAHLVHFEHHDIAGIRNDLPQSWHGCNVRPGLSGSPKEEEHHVNQASHGLTLALRAVTSRRGS